jgi:hypothetical protein
MPSLQETSVAETYRFIKEFVFNPTSGVDVPAVLEFSDTSLIMFDRSNYTIRLRRQDDTYFSTDSDIWFRTWTTIPKACRKLLMLQVFGRTPEDTFSQVRLHDGTNHYYWDGGAWSVAGAGNWNDEGTLNANIDTFPILPDREFAVVVNLVTTDKYATPYVSEIRVLMEIRIDYIEDLVFRSLIPLMKQEIRPLANYSLPPYSSDQSTIDLNDYPMDTAFNIVDVDAVFDYTADSELLTDLLSSYNPTTKVITLSSPIPAGNRPFLLLRYEPEVAYTTQQDYTEVAKVPSIVLQRLEVPIASAYNLAAREGIVDKGTGNAVLVHEPWRVTLEFRLHVQTDRSVDEFRLMSKVMEFFDKNKRLRSIGLDEYCRLQVIREFRDLITPGRADLRVFWTRFQIMDVRMPFVSEDTNGIRRLIIKLSEPAPPHEDPVKGGSRVVLTTHAEDSPKLFEEIIEITE